MGSSRYRHRRHLAQSPGAGVQKGQQYQWALKEYRPVNRALLCRPTHSLLRKAGTWHLPRQSCSDGSGTQSLTTRQPYGAGGLASRRSMQRTTTPSMSEQRARPPPRLVYCDQHIARVGSHKGTDSETTTSKSTECIQAGRRGLCSCAPPWAGRLNSSTQRVRPVHTANTQLGCEQHCKPAFGDMGSMISACNICCVQATKLWTPFGDMPQQRQQTTVVQA